MIVQKRFSRLIKFPRLAILAFLILVLLLPFSAGPVAGHPLNAVTAPNQPTVACAGGPTIDGVLLDECYDESFLVGGVTKTIRVWYTNMTTPATRTQDGTLYNLEHWITNDAQAVQVAQWGRQAWERYYAIFNHHPYDSGCSNRINIRMEDGIGWAGIAYWASPGSCWIGIDSPMVRGGGGQWVVYHEFQHYLQYSFNSGCYGFLKPNYDADAEFVEGYADLAADAVDPAIDAVGYGGITYDPSTSMYAKGYGNIFAKYFIEQLGSLYLPTDPWHHMDAMFNHYVECDNRDTLYVFDTLIPTLKPGMNEQKLFTNFFAANWSKDWASESTQPELVYIDDNGNPYGNLAPLTKDETISSATPRSYAGQSTPDKWAANYYQVTPQSGCNYVQAKVDGAPSANLGINLMAAKTSAPTSVQRFYKIGEDFSRTFRGYNTYNKILAEVNAFDSNFNYDVSFTCVTPVLNILEPRQTNFALVGDPTSPIAFLARFSVKDGANPVLGINESAITAFAGADAITIVPNTLQQVGEDYWMVLLPPVKPAGTTFVNLRICLDGSLCDTENNALLYVNPGSTDQALVFDGSGSMAIEDVSGEGTRLLNAQKAGRVMADLLRAGDRVLVTSFSAKDIPTGCGLPSGTGNCTLDILTPLPRLNITGPGNIPTVRTAIDNLTARDWTPIGAALRDAKNKLLATPTNTNPKHIILLSDGEENVNPLYGADAALRTELYNSGVVIDTIGVSGDATPALLAQIAADTGGVYRFVPTSGGTLAPVTTTDTEWLANTGMPPKMIEQVTTAAQPGPLALDNVYDYLDTKNQGASRLVHNDFTLVPDNTFRYLNGLDAMGLPVGQYVDANVNVLRIVVAGKQEDGDVSGACAGYHRDVEIADPSMGPNARWYPVSPRNPAYTPAAWDIRNSEYDDVVIIANPMQGVWQVRTRYYYTICNAASESVAPQNPDGFETDFMMNVSAESSLVLQGRFLAPLVGNQADAGDIVPIVATLLNKNGAVPGALVAALVEKPGGSYATWLLDDGMHNDGAAGDGIYGWNFSQTTVGGSYNVRIVAWLPDFVAGQWITREWLGGFWINGPNLNDLDQDGMPDKWELRCKLNISINDSKLDLDNDGLSNGAEFQAGTSPCNPDTDRGGEKDGSEVQGGRNPLYAPDDKVGLLRWYNFRAFNGGIEIRWTPPYTATHMLLFVSPNPSDPIRGIEVPNTGAYTLNSLENNTTYYLSLAVGNAQDSATGPYSEPEAVTPKADPDKPTGAVFINNGAASTLKLGVLLNISSSDTPLPGLAYPSNGGLAALSTQPINVVSAGIEMRISNDPTFAGAVWQPLAPIASWQLASGGSQVKRVYLQFRDAAGNESMVVYDDIIYNFTIFLPIVRR